MWKVLLLLAVSALALMKCRSEGFEIVYPVRLDKHRDKRDLSTRVNDVLHEEEALFGLKTKKGDFDIHVKRTTGFHPDNILLRTFDDNGVGQNTQYAPPRCFYHGQILNNNNSEVVINTCSDKGISGQVDDGEKSYHIEPIEDSEVEGAHKFYEAPRSKDEGILEDHSFGDDALYADVDESDAPLTESRTPSFDEAKFQKLSLIPGVEPQYIKYLTTTKTRYCEMFVIVDNLIYQQYGNDTKKVTHNMLNLVHHVDRAYAAINIRIVLVGVEIWTDKNKVSYYSNGDTQASAINTYRMKHLLGLLEHDIAHYMSKRRWTGSVIGKAYMNGVCSRDGGVGIDLWDFSDIRGPATLVGHELGHNFDFPHDALMKNCVCLTTRGCFMGGWKSRRNGFTTCNLQRLAKHSWLCLNNYPTGAISKSCGNGIKEPGEECDCGSPEMCERNDPCCQPNRCKLRRSAQCSDLHEDCCKNCLFKKQGTLCREAKGSCDLPEYCSGVAGLCPTDLYRKDGTTCDNHASILKGNSNSYKEHTVKLTPSIKARYLRFNPVYKNPGGKHACLRLDVLTCTADEDTTVQLNPISTPDLYWTNSLCLRPDSADCSESSSKDPNLIFKEQTYSDCNKSNLLFRLEKDGTLRHNCSGKIVCPDSTDYLFLKKNCPDGKGKYERLANFGLRHKQSGKCVEAYNFWPEDGLKTQLKSTRNCNGDESRSMLHFLAQDCILPVGMENGKFPNSSFSASKHLNQFKAHEARLHSGRGWCLSPKDVKKEYLQVDLGKVQTVGHFKMQGAQRSWVTGLRLYYSDDNITWNEYRTSGDPDRKETAYCYSGECASSLSMQCKNLWDTGASSTGNKCWNKLNTEAAGFGTCDPARNKPCASQNVYCGQLQCKSSKDKPYQINYATQYKKINANGEICSAGSITIPSGSSDDQFGTGIGMVADGTKCGSNKMCYNRQCLSFSALKIKECVKVNNLACAGRGLCNNKGMCQCERGYNPSTHCEKVLAPTDGNWGQWKEWTSCSAACKGGKRRRSRFCDAPTPAHGGSECPGDQKVTEACNTQACPKARSCRDLMSKLKAKGKPMIDNVYDIHMDNGTVMKMYCDMTCDGGGWTLIVSSHSNTWTSAEMVRERNIANPHLMKDYSMLKYADKIKDSYLIASKTYEFKLEAQNRGRWGGIWEAASDFLIDSTLTSQTNIVLKKRFDGWNYHKTGLQNIVPYVDGNKLSMNDRSSFWGKITGNERGYHPSPWICCYLQEQKPEHIWYWIREGEIKLPTSCMEIKLRILNEGKAAKSGKYLLKDEDGKAISTWCNMDSFSGGWTLLVNKISGAGWNKETILSRNVDKASLSKEFSILYHSKAVMGMRKEEKVFQYMIEADGDNQYGGIFEGAISDGLTSYAPSSGKPKLLKKFSNWNESISSLMKTNPFLVDNFGALLTTSLNPTSNKKSGVLVSQTKSIYMPKVKETPSFVRLWIREAASYESCNQLKTKGLRLGGVYKDGYYNIKGTGGNIRTVYCDMTSDAGAWTLLVTSATGGWTKPQVLSRNEDIPSVHKDYSILHLADSIKNLSNNKTFKYKLCASKFNRWGGIWEAPIGNTFVGKNPDQANVKLIKRFDNWETTWYGSPNNRMPWLGSRKGILTTSGTSDWWWYGTIVSDNLEYQPAPWLNGGMRSPGLIWYFVNEDDCDADRRQIDAGLTPWSMWSKCSAICGEGQQTRARRCSLPKSRCGGKKCAGNGVEKRSCMGECKVSPMKSSDSLYCVLPESGGCNVVDGTPLVWRYGIAKCDLPEAQFIFDADSGSIIHNCTRKPVCSENGGNDYSIPILISSKCPAMKLTRKFTRNFVGSLSFGDMCLHPSGGRQTDNVRLTLWHTCFALKTIQNLYKIEHGPVHMKYWGSLEMKKSTIEDLTSDVRFPNNPSRQGYTDNFEIPDCLGNRFGAQLSSYFVAPETGPFTFFAACDDYCQVLLSSTSTLKKDAKTIISVGGYTYKYNYHSRSDQKSGEIYLEVGKKYYIEALLVDKYGAGYLSVAYKLPSGRQIKLLRSYWLSGRAD